MSQQPTVSKIHNHAQRGFTMIELLAVVTIMLLILGGGIASFIQFNERQQMVQAVDQVQSFLRAAQTRARISEKPPACDTLQGYTVSSADLGAFYQLTSAASCDNGEYDRITIDLDDVIELTTPIDMTFRVLHGGIEGAGTVTLTRQDGSRPYSFEVNAGGEITDGAFDEE
jgi:prepilin-type N-terminal cleavage/methylation domain-containing protein